jgi:hypothetical protein
MTGIRGRRPVTRGHALKFPLAASTSGFRVVTAAVSAARLIEVIKNPRRFKRRGRSGGCREAAGDPPVSFQGPVETSNRHNPVPARLSVVQMNLAARRSRLTATPLNWFTTAFRNQKNSAPISRPQAVQSSETKRPTPHKIASILRGSVSTFVPAENRESA